ncbi:MAG: SWIM zinc finger family protein [Bacillota bacterium]
MSRYGYPKKASAAEIKSKANKAIERLRKKNPDIEPVIIEGRNLAKTWWGKAWNQNLESYADYSNRISRGRSYVRNNAVLDLKISKGVVMALVQGSSSKQYVVKIQIETLSSEKWDQVTEICNRRIESLEQLIEGRFPKELEVLFTERKYGLFPAPKEIHFSCSCPDWAIMCKHVAAVLYGVGARLDADPMLFFELRDIDGQELVRKSMERKLENMLKNAGKRSEREIDSEDVLDIFGL